MAKSNTKTPAAAPSPSSERDGQLAGLTSRAVTIVEGIAAALLPITEATRQLAGIVVEARQVCTRDVVKEQRGKKVSVSVPSWDGRGTAYRTWYTSDFLPLLERHIPEQYRSGVRQAVQNHVQDIVKETAPKADLRLLGLTSTKKTATAAAKKKAAVQRPSEQGSTTDSLASDSALAGATPKQLAEGLDRMADSLLSRVRKDSDRMSAGDRRAIAGHVKQAQARLLSVLAAVQPAPAREKAAAKQS